MKDHQFEEITFWLSLIALLIAMSNGWRFAEVCLSITTVLNAITMIYTAWRDRK